VARNGRLGAALAFLGAFVPGAIISFFTAGPALFADGPFAERPPALVASIAAFAVLGAAIGAVAPTRWKAAAVGLAVAAVPVPIVLGLDTLGQLPMTLLAAGFVLGDAAAGTFGVWAGARLRLRAR
jgi:putative Mn2+ efflux pump MntP